jgi:hypothetical protein
LEKPPNHHLLNNAPAAKIAPVVQRRMDAQTKAAAAAAPVINLNIGKDILDLLRPPAAVPEPAVAPIPALAHGPFIQPAPQYDLQYPMILQANRLPDLNMTLTKFCQLYQLHPETEQKFTEHRYGHARMLRFVTQEDLTSSWGDCSRSRCC